MLEDIQHFGITVHEHRRSKNFYSRILRMPLLGESVNSGARFDRMHRLDEVVNRVTWYQIGDGGMETFYLPRHRTRTSGAGDIRKPGYRYIAFWVDGFEEYMEHLGREGIEVKWAESYSGRCARAQDPDGVNVLLFDTGQGAPVGRVSGLKEIGLVVTDAEGYEAFFDLIGLWRIEKGCDFLEEMFGLEAPAPLYGNVRLICLPGVALPAPPRCFPAAADGACSPRDRFCDVGVKHIAFVMQDADVFYNRCRAAGVAFQFEPVTVKGGSRITYFLDPEGNTFEAMQLNPVMSRLAVAAGAARQAQMDLFAIAAKLFMGSGR